MRSWMPGLSSGPDNGVNEDYPARPEPPHPRGQPLSERGRTAGFSSCPHSGPPHSGPQLRTRRTLFDSWVWLGATEGLGHHLRLLVLEE